MNTVVLEVWIAIATALGRALTDHSIAKGIRYLDRMPTEMRVLAMRDAAARDRDDTRAQDSNMRNGFRPRSHALELRVFRNPTSSQQAEKREGIVR